MEETQKLLEKLRGDISASTDVSDKKPQMIRRNKLVKWVRARTETYEMLMRTKPDPAYMEGMAYIINKLCEEFDIDAVDLQM